MPPPERVGSAGTEVPARATETRNRTSRSHVYRVTGRSRILRLTANGTQHCPVLPARRAVGPSTSARRGLRTRALADSSCAPVPPACRYGPNVRALFTPVRLSQQIGAFAFVPFAATAPERTLAAVTAATDFRVFRRAGVRR